MKRSSFLTICVLLACAATAVWAQGPPSQVMVIRAGKLVDPDAGKVLSDQVIVVTGGRITSVGPATGAGAVSVPASLKVIDLSRMTVLPGMIDCHTHLSDGARDPSGDPLGYLKKTAAEVALESVPNAKVTLEAGFTTVRDVGVYRALNDIALRDAIARGDIIGPRMYVVGAYVTITGGAGALARPPKRANCW